MVKMYISLKHGKWVGICGELGADTTLTERFVRMGIDELSVSPSMVLGVRSKISDEPMMIYKAKDYADMSSKAANILSAQIIMKPDCVLGLATGSTPYRAV